MKNFTIENETNNIMIHGSAKEAEAAPNSERFGNEAALAKLAADWPAARLVEIWNSLPGETAVKKFKDRATAVSRIWKAIQNPRPGCPGRPEEPVSLLETRIQLPSSPRRLQFPSRKPAGRLLNRKRLFRRPRRPPLPSPLRHRRPTRRRPEPAAKKEGNPGEKGASPPRPRKMRGHCGERSKTSQVIA